MTLVIGVGGETVSQAAPGGVTVTAGYDSMGDLTSQSGSGADAATASRSFGYDLSGQVTSAGTSAVGSVPATGESFTYNDRGGLLSAAGSAGSSSFGYNGDGLVSDAAGSTAYTYDGAGRLASLADPATGSTASYSYNAESQVSRVSYGTGNDTRSLGYNGLHQLTSDTLAASSGAAVASVAYGWDANGNLTSKATSGFAGAASNTYAYDKASRLASWNNGTSAVAYGYDGAGNRTQAGSATYTYDARDQLASDGTNSYSYTARGTLASEVTPSATVAYSSDALGQAVTQGSQSYAYDALGRVLSDTGSSGSTAFSYSGSGSTLASDGSSTYTWDPSGSVLAGIGVAGGTASQGVVAFTDAHTDVTGDLTAAGSALAGSAAYDPLGNVLGSSSVAGHLGFQSGWTDPVNGRVHMGARWYDPAAGQFTTRDSVSVSPVGESAAANPFGYAGDNPLSGTDPSGHMRVADTTGWTTWAPPPPPSPSPPPPPASSCWVCGVVHAAAHWAGSQAARGFDALRHLVSSGADVALKIFHPVYRFTVDAARRAGQAAAGAVGRAARDVSAVVSDAAAWGAHAAGRCITRRRRRGRGRITRWRTGRRRRITRRRTWWDGLSRGSAGGDGDRELH